jgi:CRP-like cAMP-binding protein
MIAAFYAEDAFRERCLCNLPDLVSEVLQVIAQRVKDAIFFASSVNFESEILSIMFVRRPPFRWFQCVFDIPRTKR